MQAPSQPGRRAGLAALLVNFFAHRMAQRFDLVSRPPWRARLRQEPVRGAVPEMEKALAPRERATAASPSASSGEVRRDSLRPPADEQTHRRIFEIHMSKRGRDRSGFDLEALAKPTDGLQRLRDRAGVVHSRFAGRRRDDPPAASRSRADPSALAHDGRANRRSQALGIGPHGERPLRAPEARLARPRWHHSEER